MPLQRPFDSTSATGGTLLNERSMYLWPRPCARWRSAPVRASNPSSLLFMYETRLWLILPRLISHPYLGKPRLTPAR